METMDPLHKRKLHLTVSSSYQSVAVLMEVIGYGDLQLLHVFVAGELATLWYHNQQKKCTKESVRIWIETEEKSVVPGRRGAQRTKLN
jgi:hypothetical protein